MRTFLKTARTATAVAVLCTAMTSVVQAKDYKVAFIARAQADSFAAWLANGIADEAKKYPDIKLDVMDSQADDAKENAFIENAVASKYDLIIVQPNNGEAQRPYVEKAIKDGVKVITTNARIKNIAGSSSVDADPYAQAAVNAKAALTQVPKDVKVVVLNGPSGNMHADMRRQAWQKEFFDKRPDVKIVGEQIAHWNKEEAMRFMEDWVQANPKIDAIVSMNDNMAAGALEVVKNDPRFKGVLAYGVDGTPEAMLLIQSGKMTSTTLQNAYDLAAKNISVAHDLLTGKVTQLDTDIDCPLVNSANVADFIKVHKKSGAIK